MLNLDDLQIERDIIPLFDHTNNGNSRESLRGLFFDLPPSVAEITERQAMLKGFMANAAARLTRFTCCWKRQQRKKQESEKTGQSAPSGFSSIGAKDTGRHPATCK